MPTTSASSSSSAASSPVGPDPFSGGGVPRGPFTSAETAETSSPQSSSPCLRFSCRSLTGAPRFAALATLRLLLHVHRKDSAWGFPGLSRPSMRMSCISKTALWRSSSFVCLRRTALPKRQITLPELHPPATRGLSLSSLLDYPSPIPSLPCNCFLYLRLSRNLVPLPSTTSVPPS